MVIQTNRIVFELGGVIVRDLVNVTDCNASFGNFSFFDHPLTIRQVQNIYDLDKDIYKTTAIIPPTRDRRIRPPLISV
jgi:hypothetical protein